VALPLEFKPGKHFPLFQYTSNQNAIDIQQDRQCKCAVTLGHVRVTTVSVGDQ
jgi:hypothetical protein